MTGARLALFLMAATGAWMAGAGAFRGPHHPSYSRRSSHRSHHHPPPNRAKKIVDDTPTVHDRRHIAEDLGQAEYFQNENLSDLEMDFQYFRLHDFDNNMKLDGTELYHAILHQLERSFKDELELAEDDASADGGDHDEKYIARGVLTPKTHPLHTDLIRGVIDAALEECDKNNDGYLSYGEFKAVRAKSYAPNDETR